MSGLAARRSRELAAGAVVLALVAGAGLWWVLRSEEQGCARVRGDGRIKAVLGGGWRSDLSCGELGEKLRAVVVGVRPGVHTVAQAEAMRTVVVVLGEGTVVAPELRGPLAAALADYAADTHEVLTEINEVYNGHAGRDGVWQDGNGVHLSVYRRDLLHVLRGLAEDPSGYAALRAADLRLAAAGVASIGPEAPDVEIVSRLVLAAAPAGAFDGIADDVLRGRDRSVAQAWKGEVLRRLKESDPDDRAAAAWLDGITPADPDGADGFPRLGGQVPALFGARVAAVRPDLTPEAADRFEDRARQTAARERQEVPEVLGRGR
ncbi:hypothetical protein [Kitasatospora sp. NPDC057198]|uniref:hypothetical protein n=1 Tax=Kitasatospora sp. NPDC057198 TaxID=3346046 RepID=UPI003635BFBA